MTKCDRDCSMMGSGRFDRFYDRNSSISRIDVRFRLRSPCIFDLARSEGETMWRKKK